MTLKEVRIPWNKGLKGVQVAWNKGRPMSEERKEKWMKLMKKYAKLDGKHQLIVDDYLSGKTRVQLAKKYGVAEGAIQRVLKNKGVKCRKGGFQKGKFLPDGKPYGSQNKGKKLTKEHIRKSLRRRGKSSLEEKFERIVEELNLPYKFVGDGGFFVERKCPDFVSTNGEKIAIEVYYRRHKQLFKGNVETWINEREKIFKQEGWNLLFFDETQVNPNQILATLGGV